MKRAVHIFPSLAQHAEIAAVRVAFDPLGTKIAPHITLIFPFVDEMPTETLIAHLQSVAAVVPPFALTLGPAEQRGGGFLWLPVTEGKDLVTLLHDRLYTGPLQRFLSPIHPYIPHVTVAVVAHDRLAEAYAAAAALGNRFETRADKIVVERIPEDDTSQVLCEVPLKGST